MKSQKCCVSIQCSISLVPCILTLYSVFAYFGALEVIIFDVSIITLLTEFCTSKNLRNEKTKKKQHNHQNPFVWHRLHSYLTKATTALCTTFSRQQKERLDNLGYVFIAHPDAHFTVVWHAVHQSLVCCIYMHNSRNRIIVGLHALR